MQIREIDQDGPFATLVLEADEALRIVRDMDRAQRERNLPDLEEAAALLAMACKEGRF